MPELPEVETVVRDLRPLLTGRRIVGVRVGGSKLRRAWHPAWEAEVVGAAVREITRRGKWIIISLARGKSPAGVLLVHLGMTGQFTVNPAADAVPGHTHLTFDLSDGAELRFRDVRRFGSVEWFADAAEVQTLLDGKLGPEPFDVPPKHFRERVMRSARPLKAILLDQSVVAGVGNIYADEALYRARLHPRTRGADTTPAECERLRKAVAAVVAHAIELRGSTIRDYVGGSGLRGGFQREFNVYGRTGEPCPRCGAPIHVLRVAGRSSHFCAICQTEA